jgi:hypothetical protein
VSWNRGRCYGEARQGSGAEEKSEVLKHGSPIMGWGIAGVIPA